MIFFESESGQTIPTDLLERAARAVLDLSGSPDADLTVVLVDDARIQGLNLEFLGHDAMTDVLSFPADEPDPETGRRYLGDVVISFARAQEQARERSHAVLHDGPRPARAADGRAEGAPGDGRRAAGGDHRGGDLHHPRVHAAHHGDRDRQRRARLVALQRAVRLR